MLLGIFFGLILSQASSHPSGMKVNPPKQGRNSNQKKGHLGF